MSGGHFGSDPRRVAEPMGPMDPQGRRGHVGRRRTVAMLAFLALTAGLVVAWTLLAADGPRLLVALPPDARVQEGDEVRVTGTLRRLLSGADLGDVEDAGQVPGQPALVAQQVAPVREGDPAQPVGDVLVSGRIGERVTVAGEVAERLGGRLVLLEGD